ncbi:polysaccharide deacetylase family protein [Flavobacterium sp.]|jgi:peptidoglycan/xylan/chitin deacetylase (PgdA/CDA1 family)|uniref:polysaccharide deacetylase family protein n=1 Tax=Flavobacterium sp. TaxID=239 RepID=UPI0037C06245
MIKVPKIIKLLFFNQVWDIPNSENTIYLTFDDGPTPEITERVLEILDKHQIKATFFCIGDNVRKHPEIVQKILSKQHSVGNHTYSHLKGWRTPTKTYINNTEACRMKLNSQFAIQNSQIFRPPYGKITPWQSFKLRKLGYKIIMWDVLSKDYAASISAEMCYENVLKNVSSGSIIVFHDSNKAKENVLNSLEKTIETLKSKGFNFEKIA